MRAVMARLVKLPMRPRCPRRTMLAAALLGALALPGGVAAQPGAVPFAHDWSPLRAHASAWERLLAAEDARARTPEQLAVLHEGLRSTVPELRATAVRALGRLERASELSAIVPLLEDDAPVVRAYAANAAAQALVRVQEDGARAAAREALIRALDAHRADSISAPVMAESLGRIRHESPDAARRTVELLLPLLHQPSLRLGAVRGLYFLSRQQGMRPAWSAASLDALRAGYTAAGDDVEGARFRGVLVAALAAAGGADVATLRSALRDVSPHVRREAVLASAGVDAAAARDVIQRALNDGSGSVRHEALRQYGRRLAATDGCAPVVAAAGDPHPHTALLALELLAACGATSGVTDLLEGAARTPRTGSDAYWHRPARALLSLAAVDSARARPLLAAFADDRSFFVRTWAARAAARVGDEALLRRLAADPHANVRVAAVEGLHALLGRQADDVLVAQLARDENELLQVAARVLDGTTHPQALDALLGALTRVTARQEETTRDARRALLTRAGPLGSAPHAPRLEPLLRDFDPVIAGLAADVIAQWTGTRPEPEPVAPPALPLPTLAETMALAAAAVVIELEDGHRLDLRLLPWEAPTNAARFARLAAAGYYDGLTLHRVVPNFVVQGGSPGASEYTGDGPFTRDELGLARNWRGTVGLSTRGRDTGDAQFYINLIDSVRLDHEYTVFAEIVAGMPAVDAVLEGAVIRRVTVGR